MRSRWNHWHGDTGLQNIWLLGRSRRTNKDFIGISGLEIGSASCREGSESFELYEQPRHIQSALGRFKR